MISLGFFLPYLPKFLLFLSLETSVIKNYFVVEGLCLLKFAIGLCMDTSQSLSSVRFLDFDRGSSKQNIRCELSYRRLDGSFVTKEVSVPKATLQKMLRNIGTVAHDHLEHLARDHILDAPLHASVFSDAHIHLLTQEALGGAKKKGLVRRVGGFVANIVRKKHDRGEDDISHQIKQMRVEPDPVRQAIGKHVREEDSVGIARPARARVDRSLNSAVLIPNMHMNVSLGGGDIVSLDLGTVRFNTTLHEVLGRIAKVVQRDYPHCQMARDLRNGMELGSYINAKELWIPPEITFGRLLHILDIQDISELYDASDSVTAIFTAQNPVLYEKGRKLAGYQMR